MKIFFNIFILLTLLVLQLKAQDPTIGLLQIDQDKISDGYTLFCPWTSQDYYLINNCGEKVNTWNTSLSSTLKMAYLDEEGNFLILNDDEIYKYDWDSNKIWQFTSRKYGLIGHHDFQLMSNGNIIVIAKEEISNQEAFQLGFDTFDLEGISFAIDGLHEFEHVEEDSFNLVWKWSFKDHLVQEKDSSLNNYGLSENSPRKLNAQFTLDPDKDDLLHCNGVDYNEALDQLIISSRNTSEIYIIDHSTSTEEAATSSGGQQGFGGDFLWRWGDQNLLQQHDPNWIPADHPNGGLISIFNNIDGLGNQVFSSIKIIDPPLDAQGKYLLDTLNQFLPKEPLLVISGLEHEIFSPFMSGAHSQPNGNFIICSGRFGDYYELTAQGELVWKYHSPIFQNPLPQFSAPMASFTFNIKKYPTDFIGFQGKDLTPKGLVENQNPLSEICISSTGIDETSSNNLTVFPNPSSGDIFFQSNIQVTQIKIFALSGKKIMEIDQPSKLIDIKLENGTYLFQFKLKNHLINKLVCIIP